MSFDPGSVMEDPPAIRVRDLSKHYLIYERPEDRLKQMLVPRLQRALGREPRRYYRDFAALQGVSFEVQRGETVGIIGRNGSGKSTLLQMICGTLRPTGGSVEVNGRIAALLELGAGFNPEFTGRENVFLNAAILGLSRAEVEDRFDAIAAFADIGQFIERPVKTYSSGMFVRLAFATAINVDPDILVVDEALAVGDEAFQRKCFARIEQIQEKGATVLFVSHGVQSIVQLCSRAMLMEGGELLLQGSPKMVTSQYMRLSNASPDVVAEVRSAIRKMRDGAQPSAPTPGSPLQGDSPEPATRLPDQPPESDAHEAFDATLVAHPTVLESRGARIRNVCMRDRRGRQVNVLEMGRAYTYEYWVDFDAPCTDVGFALMIRTVTGIGLSGAATNFSKNDRVPEIAEGSVVRIRFDFTCPLTPGVYFLNAGVLGTTGGESITIHRILDAYAIRVTPVAGLISTGFFDLNVIPDIQIEAPSLQAVEQGAIQRPA